MQDREILVLHDGEQLPTAGCAAMDASLAATRKRDFRAMERFGGLSGSIGARFRRWRSAAVDRGRVSTVSLRPAMIPGRKTLLSAAGRYGRNAPPALQRRPASAKLPEWTWN